MERRAGLIGDRLRRKIGIQTVLCGDRANDRDKGARIIGGRESLSILEVDLILTGSRFMVRAFGHDAHLLERQAYLAADILALIQRRDIHIASVIVGNSGSVSVFISLEKIELHLGLEVEAIALLAGIFYSAAQQ